jgi:hypothetical protein
MNPNRDTKQLSDSELSSMVIWSLLGYIVELERHYQALQREYDALLAALWGTTHAPASPPASTTSPTAPSSRRSSSASMRATDAIEESR